MCAHYTRARQEQKGRTRRPEIGLPGKRSTKQHEAPRFTFGFVCFRGSLLTKLKEIMKTRFGPAFSYFQNLCNLGRVVMTREPTYQAARAVAATIEAHFARHLVEARRRGEQKLAHAPDARTIEAIIDAGFWASFRPEEGRFPKISLAFLSPEQAGQPLMFEERLPLTSDILTKL